ncbi:diguanylate cyclase domain-containing protein [Azoarcus olearius]|uniref:GGDEF/PAS-domain containing protein n=1 Tax=Azoarcus sp. (strain BH72) TaxID=418699 RepID=A1K2I8_AZOSB|nr:diguanylate cyclase [Azoarcus olearius]CAL93043.1 GGDEF/PAS-domain containing protein [Azoarcus olearius]
MSFPPRQPLIGRDASPAARGFLVTIAVVVLVVSIEWAAWRQYRAFEQRQATAEFARIADQATLSLMQQTAHYRNALLALRATWLASERFDPDEFARYVRALSAPQSLPGLRAFAFNRAVEERDRAAYVQRIRREYSAHDPIYNRFDIYPDGIRERYHVVEMIQPPSGNQRSLGYDLGTSDVRRVTVEHALQHGFAATPPIQLQQAPGVLAILILAPLRNVADTTASAADTRDTVAASFLVNEMVNAAISPSLRKQFHLRITDLGATEAAIDTATPLYADNTPPGVDSDPRTVTREESFGGRRWQLRFQPTEPAARPLADTVLFGLLAAGALLAGLVSHLAMQHARRVVRHQALVRLGSDCILELDAGGRVREADNAAQRITGLPPREWEGEPLWRKVAEEDALDVERAVRQCIERREPVVIECRVPDDSGGPPRWISMRLGNHLDHPYLGCLFAQISNIDARKEVEAEVARLAFYDPLTGLPNRRLLEARAELTLAAARRHNGHAAVMVLDLDGFKEINDSAGHAVGDEVLAQLATRLRHVVRDSDTVARLGGDEFVILLGEPAGEAEVRTAAVRISHALTVPLTAAGHNWLVTASVGIALHPDHGDNFADLLGAADTAMYRSKRTGRGLTTVASGRSAGATPRSTY